MIKEINEIINNLEQTLGWCDRITTGNLPHKIGNLKQCLVSTIELLKVLNIGWHPASELPIENSPYIHVVFCKGNNGWVPFTGYGCDISTKKTVEFINCINDAADVLNRKEE